MAANEIKQVYDFLCDVAGNNNREWFNANKERYLRARDEFSNFVGQLIDRISEWDSDIAESNLTPKDVTYRFYRDTRFSKDKSPYKTHFGAYICKGGRKSAYSGYYFHLEPKIPHTPNYTVQNSGFLGESLLAVGLYRPEPVVIRSLRDEISVNGDSFLNAISLASPFTLDTFNSLKRLPRGFEDVEPRWQELLKLKDFSLFMPLDEKVLFSSSLLDTVCAHFMKCAEFNRVVNLAVDFAFEQGELLINS